MGEGGFRILWESDNHMVGIFAILGANGDCFGDDRKKQLTIRVSCAVVRKW
jgi:hypothetical protein